MLSLSTSLLPKCSFFSTSKLRPVKSSNEPQTQAQANEDCRKQMTKFLLKECRLPESQVLATGRRCEDLFKCTSISRAQEAVQFFRDSGFTEDQVRKIVLISPNSLLLKVETQLKPKIEFMKSLGFSGSNVAHIVSLAPRFLPVSMERNLRPKIDLLKQSIMQDELLLDLIWTNPNILSLSEETIKLRIDYVKSLSVLEGSKTFAIVLSVVFSSGLEKFEKKLKHLATLGLLENEIRQIVTTFPTALCAGMDKMTKNMDFLTNTAGFQPNIVVSYPALLNYSVQKRLQPRHEVIEFLRKTDPTRLPKNVVYVYYLSERRFEERFLKGSPEATKIFEKYKGKSVDPAIS